ncbi:MAG: 2,3-bisphosphoglycerate-independent phosphoglycerate mutase [Gammaproteobacteria bacterium]|nr:2,3-bisphosphoglycerate-independent phosphoglycerate mutase [Gammaproteobacteria bacterium]
MEQATLRAPRRPTLLVILDGFGLNPETRDNAIAEAGTPHLDHYFARYPNVPLRTSGRAVGLPEGQMGNSEVGHITLGSGAIVRQYLVRIDDAIADGSFRDNAVLRGAAERAAAAGRPLHLVGLVSDGGVHSHVRHVLALIELAKRAGAVPQLHFLGDGRDTPPRSAATWLPELEAALADAGGRIATVTGRYYGMDRDQRWERTERAWRAMVGLGGERTAPDAAAAIEAAYAADEGDEFIKPTVINGAEPVAGGDEVIFFNFRNDRPRQLAAALSDPAFDRFARPGFAPASVTTLTDYGAQFDLPVAFGQEAPDMTLGQWVSDAGIAQFRTAETEKYAHVTFFFNGGREPPYPGEERLLVPSPKVASYDLQPEMSAPAVADAVIGAMESGKYGLVIVNFANGDMVGHTAVRPAILEAVRTLDREVGRVLDAAVEAGFSVVLTADHGNCEQMIDPESGEPHTQHTTFPVPCLVIDDAIGELDPDAGLADIAPTVLQLMGLEIPPGMSGHSLLRRVAA